MNTIADFSYETDDASKTAELMVKHNREHRSPDINWIQCVSAGPDGRTWLVAWVFKPSTGEVIVCWWSPAAKYLTDDGIEITADLRVFTNDWQWGTLIPEQFENPGACDPGGKYFNGWFRVLLDSGAEKIYNGERMTTRPPLL